MCIYIYVLSFFCYTSLGTIFYMGVIGLCRKFTSFRYKRGDGLMCVANSAFLEPQNYADLDLKIADAELSALCSVS
jgi:hypothetical protein